MTNKRVAEITVDQLALPCSVCGQRPRHVTSGGIVYKQCRDCRRIASRRWHSNYLENKRLREEGVDAQPLSEETQSGLPQSTRVLAPTAPKTPRKVHADPKAKVEENEPRLETEGPAWVVLSRMSVLGDKARLLVEHGFADNFNLSADVPEGVTFTLNIKRTGRDAD